MQKRVLRVTIKTEVEERGAGGKVTKVAFTTPFVEVGGGHFSRRFERTDEPFVLRGEEEITAVLATGHFDVVEGSERYEDDAPAAPASEAVQQGDQNQGEQPQGEPAKPRRSAK